MDCSHEIGFRFHGSEDPLQTERLAGENVPNGIETLQNGNVEVLGHQFLQRTQVQLEMHRHCAGIVHFVILDGSFRQPDWGRTEDVLVAGEMDVAAVRVQGDRCDVQLWEWGYAAAGLY